MPGKQKADPIAATTYAGFAASAPSEAASDGPELRLSGEARTYAREELRRRTRRRRRTPVAAVAVLAVAFVGAAVGVALLYEPQANLPALPPPPAETAPSHLAEVSLPSAGALAPPLPEETQPAAPAAIEVPPAQAPAAAPRPPPRPVAPVAAPKAPPAAKARSAAQAAADRAATARVSALAALDQEVNKAYAEALNAGAAPAPLAAAQQEWIIRRDRIRREDPEMAEDVARARIAQLQAIATRSARGGGAPLGPEPQEHAETAKP